MKIALCLSGQIRSFEKGFEYVKSNLLDHYSTDVFIHTWSKNWTNKVIELYSPKDILIEDDSIFQNFSQYKAPSPRHYVLRPARNTILLYRSIRYADILRQSYNEKYDFVIRSRFDFALNVKINFEQLDKDKIYFCNTRANSEKTIMHDQFAIAHPSLMSRYSSLYSNIDTYHYDGCLVNGENLLEYHMLKTKLAPDHVDYLNLNPPFVDGRYNSGKHSLIRNDMEKWI